MVDLTDKLNYKPERKPCLFKHPRILLQGNIPKPLHGLNPRTILGQEWWDNERRKAYRKNNYHCWACGVHKSEAEYYHWLEGHEIYFINWALARSTYKGCYALCHACHNYIHSGRMEALVDKGEMKKKKYRDIMRHGMKVTQHLREPDPPRYICQDWSRWHLVIDGTKYYSKFKSESHWRQHYG